MNVAIFYDIVWCSPSVNRRFGGMYHHLQDRKSAKKETSLQCSTYAVKLIYIYIYIYIYVCVLLLFTSLLGWSATESIV
jgi:hypothetical protein